LRRENGPAKQVPALHAAGHVVQEYCVVTAQNVPNTGSVNPPDIGQVQLSVVPEY
jgi:hypothetical protein